MGFVDTRAFATLSGITGYRIDRRETGDLTGNWVADDFTFESAAVVPEPASAVLLLAGLLAVATFARPASSGSPGPIGTRR